ncbi:M28 family peptidase [Novosphingobium sp.]|uniref:M28 family peptidase n=1 Tax=Novosphingobium sp. TaxID=1874826 RepID=UPI003BAA849F
MAMRGAGLKRLGLAAAALLALPGGAARAEGPAPDAQTRAWWALTRELSSDAMEGRDTGSRGYDRAAAIVAKRFAAAGLKPVGTGGGWFQPITFEDLRLDEARSRLLIGGQRLRFNRDVQLSPSAATPKALMAPATFRGYCSAAEIAEVKGQVVVCYGRPAPARVKGFDRAKALREAGAAGMLLIAAPGLPGEPIRWPFAYSRSVTPLEDSVKAAGGASFLQGTLNPDALARLTAQAGEILRSGAAGADLPRAELGQASAALTVTRRVTRSANVLGLLPGTDPALADQAIVIAAHLDGYGRGEPVAGGAIYNGTLDDAAYVALLEQFAAMRAGKGLKRPVLFAVFTGEEKGLWGSRWFVKHPTVPIASLAAVINLDQVRPLYPLKLLTVHGLKESSLGDLVRQVATARGIAVQEDPEPERDLLRRSDNWPLMEAGVPGASFVFATYDAASRAAYRDWYERRYHHPADDLSTPLDWQAAADFNRFFTALTEAAAEVPERMAWAPGARPGTR